MQCWNTHWRNMARNEEKASTQSHERDRGHQSMSSEDDESRKIPKFILSHRDEIIEAARRRGFSNVRVFGSMARGDYNDDSDVDLLVDYGPAASIFSLGALMGDCETILERRVDVITLGSLSETARQRVLGEVLEL